MIPSVHYVPKRTCHKRSQQVYCVTMSTQILFVDEDTTKIPSIPILEYKASWSRRLQSGGGRQRHRVAVISHYSWVKQMGWPKIWRIKSTNARVNPVERSHQHYYHIQTFVLPVYIPKLSKTTSRLKFVCLGLLVICSKVKMTTRLISYEIHHPASGNIWEVSESIDKQIIEYLGALLIWLLWNVWKYSQLHVPAKPGRALIPFCCHYLWERTTTFKWDWCVHIKLICFISFRS